MRHVFISYSKFDNDFAQLLKTELENAGIHTWLAIENLKAGEEWREGIDKAIKDSFAFVVILSSSSDQSKYVTYEWALAYGMEIRIIPILYKQLNTGEKFHPRLETLQYEDFTSTNNRPWKKLIDRIREIQEELLEKEQKDPKIEEALRALKDWDAVRIMRAADYLGRRKAQSAVPELERLLEEPEVDLQKAALKALGQIGISQNVEKIIAFATKGETQFDAIEALGNIADIRAEKTLIQIAQSGNSKARILSVSALNKISSIELKGSLIKFLQESTYESEDYIDDDGREWDSSQLISTIFEVLSNRINAEDNQELLNILRIESSPAYVKSGVIQLIGTLKNKSSLDSLIKVTRDKSKSVREAALSAIKNFDGISDFEQKLRLLESQNKDSQKEAIDFFYNNFGIEGLIYALAYEPSRAYWAIESKIEEEFKDDFINRMREALKDPEVRVRGLVAEVARNLNLKVLANDLKPLINDDAPFVRGLVIRAIGDLKFYKAKRELKAKLKDNAKVFSNDKTEVRNFAAIALAKLGYKTTIPFLQELILNGDDDLQDEAVNLIVSLGEPFDISVFHSALYNTSHFKRLGAIKVLGMIEKNIDVIALFNKLEEDNTKDHAKAIQELSDLYIPMGLIIGLGINNGKARWEIAEKLKNTIIPEHGQIVRNFITDDRTPVRAFLAETIGLRPDLQLGENLIPLVDDASAFVRGLAIRALGRLKCRAAIEKLRNRLSDVETIFSNSKVRVCEHSAYALISMGEPFPVQLLKPLIENIEGIYYAIFKNKSLLTTAFQAELADELIRILPDSNSNIAYKIVNLIGEVGSSKDACTLLNIFAESSFLEWYSVKEAVIKIADQSIKEPALKLLDKDNNELKMACLDILEKYGDSAVIGKLLEMLNNENDSMVTFRIINVLAAYGDISLLPMVIPFSSSSDSSLRASAVRAYGKLKHTSSLSLILPYLNTDESFEVRRAAIEALIYLDDPKNIDLVINNLLIWEDYKKDYLEFEFDLSCIEAIGKLGNTLHVPILQKIVKEHPNEDYRACAITALGSLKDTTAIPIMIEKLKDTVYSFFCNDLVCNIAGKFLQEIDSEQTREALKNWEPLAVE